ALVALSVFAGFARAGLQNPDKETAVQLQIPLTFPARASSEPRVKLYNNFDLRKILVRFSREGDGLSEHRATQHVLNVGATGASKSTSVMDLLARSVMEAGWGVYSMSAKVSAAEDMYEAALKSGIPESRIVYWAPGSGHCFNWADHEYHGYG